MIGIVVNKITIFTLLSFLLSTYSHATHKVDEDSSNQQATSTLILETPARPPAYFLGIIPKVVANQHILPRLKYEDFLAITLASRSSCKGMQFWWNKMNSIKQILLAPIASVVESEERRGALELAKHYRLPLVSIERSCNSLKSCSSQANLKDVKGICYFAARSLKRAISCTVLNLGHQQLTFIPDCIGQMTGLKELYLMNNKLTKLPGSIGRLPNLSILWIHDNLLSEIPESILKSRKLESFWFQNNPLKVTPKLIHSDLSGKKLSKSERVEKEGFTVKAKNEKADIAKAKAPKRKNHPAAKRNPQKTTIHKQGTKNSGKNTAVPPKKK